MSEINLGPVSLTQKQLSRLHEANGGEIRGFRYKDGQLTVNHQKDSLTDAEKAAVIAKVQAIPDDITDKRKRLNELGSKPVLSPAEITEVLKLRGII